MNQEKRKHLINALINRPDEQNIKLREIVTGAKVIAQRVDWLWHLLLSAMSTMGNSRGHAGLMLNNNNYQFVSYSNLLSLDFNKRLLNLQTGLRQANVRRYAIKAIWLNRNFSFIQDCGGLDMFQTFISQTNGRESKIRLMKIFDGIGDKYARNIFMEIHHQDFINSIAIDERIKDISEELGIDGTSISYVDHESIFVEIAKEADLTPWQMDRLLYFYTRYYLRAMNNGV